MSFLSRPWRPGFTTFPEGLYQRVAPTAVPEPYLVAYNQDFARELGLDPDAAANSEAMQLLAGNHLPSDISPVAAVYAGHQFGVWVPRLGDGRAILLGEFEAADRQRWEVQLKGAGLTRYSRMGDGRAVLRSTIREYLGSEAMHGLGIPTTRALAIVGSDLPVFRERTETAAVLTRLAPTFIRFGSFEYFASQGDDITVRFLADHLIERFYPQLLVLPEAKRYSTWFGEVVTSTALLMADWIATGWTHGVMNTDNMSILGLTIDFGPFGWLDEYQPDYIPNHTDSQGRYAYAQQPAVGLWNLARLAEALHSLVPEADAVNALDEYREVFALAMEKRMRAKLGLATAEREDPALLEGILSLMHTGQADYTRVFRALSRWDEGNPAAQAIHGEFHDHAALSAWLELYRARLEYEDSVTPERHGRMLRINPKFVLRNWMAQDAINLAETRNYAKVELLRSLLATPFDEHPEHEEYAAKPPEWAKGLVLSCSS